MAILKSNDVRLPMWGARLSFVSGQNPLGLQNASEALFTALLPGITNLTNHIRYYSLYCWLLDHYAHEERDTTVRNQQNFIRRAEVQIALLMRLHENAVGSVPGSDHINPWISEEEGTAFKLADHADLGSSHRTYWQQSWGSFGTYYVGALQQLRLIVKGSDGVYRCTEDGVSISGTHLAKAFQKSTDEATRQDFLSNVRKGELPRSETERLHQVFSLRAVMIGSAEHDALLGLLLGPDAQLPLGTDPSLGTFRRRSTIRHVLRALTHGEEITAPNDFTLEVYLGQGALLGERDEVLTGWYLYMMNEFWHYGAGAMFCGMLERMAEAGVAVQLPMLVQEYVNDVLEIIKVSCNGAVLRTTADLVQCTNDDMSEIEASANTALRSHDHRRAAAFGWLMLMRLYRSNEQLSGDLHLPLKQLGGDREGHVLEFIEYLRSRLDQPLASVLRDFVLRYLVYHHQFVAVRKAGTGALITLKFILEDQLIRHVETFSPSYTGSRLPALFNVFRDMGYLDKEDGLTAASEVLLQDLRA